MEGSNTRAARSRFGNATAKACVDAALALISVFPDTPDMEWLLTTTPWCSVLHLMMQAVTILLIQLSVGPVEVMATHGTQSGQGEDCTAENPNVVLEASKKIIRWLHCLAEQDASARRAFKICNGFIHRICSVKGFNLHGLPSNTSLPEHTSGFQSGQLKRRESKDDCESGILSQGSQKDKENWGPDRTVNEARLDDYRQTPYSLDPALFSWVDMVGKEDCLAL
ncbi:hypothetical protein N7451_012717 [Penicillium sp. IBT 35674x]|nr:hypothetical protein N7451_012717 [Penicillium sp. IBT 35674x]